MKRNLLFTALIAASLGFLLASPASATPCKDKTTTTAKPTTTTTEVHKPPCSKNTPTTKPSAPTTIAPTTTTSVKSVPAGVTTTTTVPEDDSLTPTDYNLPQQPVGTPETPVQLAPAASITRDAGAAPPTELAVTGAPSKHTIALGLGLLTIGALFLWGRWIYLKGSKGERARFDS